MLDARRRSAEVVGRTRASGFGGCAKIAGTVLWSRSRGSIALNRCLAGDAAPSSFVCGGIVWAEKWWEQS